MKDKLNIGILGVCMPDFVKDNISFNKNCLQLRNLCSQNQVNLIEYIKQITIEHEAEDSCKFFKDKSIDLLFILNSSFADGNIINPFARLGIPLALWSISEPQKSGPLPLNSFCGMNMLSSIIGVYLKDFDIKFKWFFGNPTEKNFKNRFDIMIKAQKVIKKLKNSTIGLIGGVASGFNDLYFDERKIFKTFGTRINKDINIDDILKKIDKFDMQKVYKSMGSYIENARCINVSNDEIERAYLTYLSLKEFSSEGNFDALAVSCWPKFQSNYNLAACSTLGRLLDDGIIASCEGDVMGALSMLILKLLSDTSPTILDFISFDIEDASIQMWHCGPSPCNLSEDGKFDLNKHHQIIYTDSEKNIRKMGSIRNMYFKKSDVTFFRIDTECEKYFTFQGETMSDKQSYDGSKGWFHKLNGKNNKLNVYDLIETIMFYKLPHHYPMATGSLSSCLYELGSWLGLKSCDIISYSDYKK